MPIRHLDEIRELALALEQNWTRQLDALQQSGVPLNAFDNVIGRNDVPMPEEVSNALIKGLDNQSVALSQFTRIPVGRAQLRLPVLQAMPIAYWVSGDTGLKQTSEASWGNKYLNIEELAVIIPIPDNVLDDSGFPIWEQVQPLAEQAAGRTLDAAIFFGASAPASFPTNVASAIATAGNTVNRNTSAAAAGGFATDLGNVFGAMEIDGYDPSAGIGSRAAKGYARSARNSLGDRFAEFQLQQDGFEMDGVTIATDDLRGLWPSASGTAEVIVFDRSEFVLGLRQDITWKLLDQAVIQDGAGNIVYNLPQQDMIAMRMTMRVGWQVANTINYDQPIEGNRYPAAALLRP